MATATTAPPAPDSILDRLRHDANVIFQKEGVTAFGLFVEVNRFMSFDDSLDANYRFFVLENSLSAYQRQRGKKAGRWTTSYAANHQAAMTSLYATIESLDRVGRTTEIRGVPMLVQATVADLVAVRNKEKNGPDCRWRGAAYNDSRYGKVTDETKGTK